MPDGTLSKLNTPHPPVSKAGGLSWAKRIAPLPAKKPSLPVIEVKKAMKLMKGAGKSIAAIEVLPDGGFRILATGHAAPVQSTSQETTLNAWEEWIANDQS